MSTRMPTDGEIEAMLSDAARAFPAPPEVKQAVREQLMGRIAALQVGDDATVAQAPSQSLVRLVPDVPTELADGVLRETHPMEQPPNRRHVRGRFAGMLHRRTARWSIVVAAIAATAGFAGTQAGRKLLRRIVTPVWKSQMVEGPVVVEEQKETVQPDGTIKTETIASATAMFATSAGPEGGDVPPISAEQAAAMQAEMAEIETIRRAGGGRLTGLMEGLGLDRESIGPDKEHPHTSFDVEYTLSNGKTVSVGTYLTPLQRKNMRVDEILTLRDSGAGQVISSQPFWMGLGRYTIRFTLADGTNIDLGTFYPPGTREGREQIFAETRRLKAARKFTVEHADSGPDGQVYGLLRYTLADGRQVGLSEQVPPDVVSKDGKQVITYELQNAPATDRP